MSCSVFNFFAVYFAVSCENETKQIPKVSLSNPSFNFEPTVSNFKTKRNIFLQIAIKICLIFAQSSQISLKFHFVLPLHVEHLRKIVELNKF